MTHQNGDAAPVPDCYPPGRLEGAKFCDWYRLGERPCYGPPGYVLVDSAGGTLANNCAAHLERWPERTSVPYRGFATPEWVTTGCGYWGRHLGC